MAKTIPRLVMHLARLTVVLLLGGLLGATLVRYAPGFGVDEQELDARLSHESQEALRLAGSSHESIFVYYQQFLIHMFKGDLGFSRTLQAPVRELLKDRIPDTLKTVASGLVFGWSAGIVFAAVPIVLRSWTADLFTSLAAAIVLSIPSAMLALLFVLGHAPGRLVIGLIVFPKVFRYARNLLMESATQAHVITAWAKGLGSMRVLLQHILRTVAPQLLALAGVSVSVAFAAAIPVEVVCDLPGIGQLAWKAAMGRDLPLLVDLTLVVTIITLIANSAADLTLQGRQTGEA